MPDVNCFRNRTSFRSVSVPCQRFSHNGELPAIEDREPQKTEQQTCIGSISDRYTTPLGSRETAPPLQGVSRAKQRRVHRTACPPAEGPIASVTFAWLLTVPMVNRSEEEHTSELQS